MTTSKKKTTFVPLYNPQLTPFDGRDVISSAIKITKAGDGLSTALQVEPGELHVGDEMHVVLKCVVGDVAFKPVSDTDCLTRVHNLVTQEATFIDGKQVAKLLDEQRRKIEQAAGIERIPFEDDDGAEGD